MWYQSNTKLLLTGEYLVLFGARALALPLKFSQTLSVETIAESDKLIWKSFENEHIWFEAAYDLSDFKIIISSSYEIANKLRNILLAARELNSNFIKSQKGIAATTSIDFKRDWGLGTSSTLIVNIAKWAEVDPFALHSKVSSGSGYDIACALHKSPLVYSVRNNEPKIEVVSLSASISSNIYFVYLGNKQDSAKSISSILGKGELFQPEIKNISQITDKLLKVGSVSEAISLIQKHEEVISFVLNLEPIQKRVFPDFKGAIKSLGAWGGDFIMALSDEPEVEVRTYFISKGYIIIFRYSEIAID
jgi:mevalonate kinase